MAIEKHGTSGIQERKNGDGSISYRAQVRMRGLPYLSKTFTRSTDATTWLEHTKATILGSNAVTTETPQMTLREVLERYLREVTPQQKRGARREQDRVKAWMQNPLALRFLSHLNAGDFARYRDRRRADNKAENTIRIELALIGKLFRIAARDWGMRGLRNPIDGLTMSGGSKMRERRLTPNEESALMTELICRGPYMEPLAALVIETAMRQGELLALTWRDINLQERVAHLHDTRTSAPRDVPLSRRAADILNGLPRQVEDSSPVFPLKQDNVSRIFKDACKAAGITNLKFQDLRHKAVAHICEKLPLHEAMRITGHKTPSTLMKYYPPKGADLAGKLV